MTRAEFIKKIEAEGFTKRHMGEWQRGEGSPPEGWVVTENMGNKATHFSAGSFDYDREVVFDDPR